LFQKISRIPKMAAEKLHHRCQE